MRVAAQLLALYHNISPQEDAGFRVWTDVVGNVHGRVEARRGQASRSEQ